MDTKKYIIDLPDNTAWLQWVKVADKDGNVYFDSKNPEDLIPYIEPDLDAVRNEAYKEAYDKGYQDAVMKIGSDEQAIAEKAYQGGRIDAWNAARKIACDRAHGGFRIGTKQRIFGAADCAYILANYTASEAVEKIRQYEQEQEEIKIGDEVNGARGKGIITNISDNGNHFNVMWENGSTGCYMMEDFKKTGRHFSEIAEILKKMQEEKE